MLDNFAAAGE